VEIENKLKEMGFELPNPPLPAANYIGCVRVGNLLFVGGNIGRINGELRYSGKVGDKVTLEQAYEAARNCALNHLAIIKAAIGDLDKVERIVKVLGYVNVAPGFHGFAGSVMGREGPACPRGGGCCLSQQRSACRDRSHRSDSRVSQASFQNERDGIEIAPF